MRKTTKLDGNAPAVLLFTTCRWPFPARLGMALHSTGCTVYAVCPVDHPITRIRGLRRSLQYNALTPLWSLSAAIERVAPDMILPCDDRATAQMHELYRCTAIPGVRTLIARSLGSPESFPVTVSRQALLSTAKRLSIDVPESDAIPTPSALRDWLHAHGFPAYLKADGSSGGTGVKLLTCFADAERAFAELHAPPGLLRAAKRTLLDRDPTLLFPALQRSRPEISVQRHIAGKDANSLSFCSEGEVLGTVAVEVLETRNNHGPSTVVRMLEHPGIDEAARKIARELRLSGFFGLDFLIEEQTGTPYLIEMNPRATQIAHFACGEGRDPAAAVAAALTGQLASARPPMTDQTTVALFPQEWHRDARSSFLRTAHHDVPWEEPELVQMAHHRTPQWRRWMTFEHWTDRRAERSGKVGLKMGEPVERH